MLLVFNKAEPEKDLLKDTAIYTLCNDLRKIFTDVAEKIDLFY